MTNKNIQLPLYRYRLVWPLHFGLGWNPTRSEKHGWYWQLSLLTPKSTRWVCFLIKRKKQLKTSLMLHFWMMRWFVPRKDDIFHAALISRAAAIFELSNICFMNVDMKNTLRRKQESHSAVWATDRKTLLFWSLSRFMYLWIKRSIFVYFRKSTVHVSGILKKTQPIGH